MNTETKYQALASWLTYRLEGWRTHRNINYIPMWDEYYRLWRGIWSAEDKTRQTERSRLIAPAPAPAHNELYRKTMNIKEQIINVDQN